MSLINIIFIVIAIVVVWIIAIYNSFVTLINRVKESWADIDVQLKRRYDLIPNLVNTVKGYMTHEAGTFEKVTEARNMAMRAGNIAEQEKAENILSGALKSLFAVAESYPNLKANENFLELQRELSDTENKIQAARRFYNTNVRDLNTKVESFPSNMIANMFHFEKADFFLLALDAVAKEPIAVHF